MTVIEAGPGRPPLLMFLNEMPPRHTDLWVVRHSLSDQPSRTMDETVAG